MVASYEEATTILHLELSVEWPTPLPLPLSDQLAATIALIMRAAQAFAKLWHLQLYADSQLVREWKKKRRRLPGDSDDINNSSLLCLRLAITARVGERARKRGQERKGGSMLCVPHFKRIRIGAAESAALSGLHCDSVASAFCLPIQ